MRAADDFAVIRARMQELEYERRWAAHKREEAARSEAPNDRRTVDDIKAALKLRIIAQIGFAASDEPNGLVFRIEFSTSSSERHALFAPVEKYPVEIQRTPGDEVYWFDWNNSFSGSATIRVSKLGGEVIVVREYRPSRYGKLRRFAAC